MSSDPTAEQSTTHSIVSTPSSTSLPTSDPQESQSQRKKRRRRRKRKPNDDSSQTGLGLHQNVSQNEPPATEKVGSRAANVAKIEGVGSQRETQSQKSSTQSSPDRDHQSSTHNQTSPHSSRRRKRRSRKSKSEDPTHPEQPKASSHSQRRSRRGISKRQSSPRHPETAQSKIKRAVSLLDEIIREEADKHEITRLGPLHLNLILGGSQQRSDAPLDLLTTQVDKLYEQINRQVQAQIPNEFRQGTVYCFHSDDAIPPPSPELIFNGYDAVGRPIWIGLLPLCLTLGVDHLDRLYARPPQAIKLLQAGPIGAQLIPEVRGGRVYDVLSQLVIGPLSTRFRPLREQDDRHTITAQVVLTQPKDRPQQIRFNLLGLDPDSLFDAAAKSAPRGPLARARNSIHHARREVRRLQELLAQGKVSTTRLKTDSQQILDTLGDQLLRVISGDEQRTEHARRRHHSMERPTSEARRDAARAGDERLFVDVHQDTIVVIGPRGRAHIFTEEGRHVTSMRLGVGEVDRKQQQGRWRSLNTTRARRFKTLFKGQSS